MINGGIIKTKLLIFHLTNLLYLMSFSIWALINWNNYEIINNVHVKIFPWIVALIIIQSISLYIKRVSRYDFSMWFLIISYFFMFGNSFIQSMGLKTTLLWNPVELFTKLDIFHSYVFIVISLHLFLMGYLLLYKKSNLLENKSIIAMPNKNLLIFGTIILLIGFFSKLIYDINIINVTRSANSYSAYSQGISVGIWDDLSSLFLPGIFCILFSGKVGIKGKKIIFYLVMTYFIILMILTGSRKIQLFSIISLFLGYSASNNGIRKKSIFRIILYVILTMVVLNILIVIREYRFNLNQILPQLISRIFSFDIFNNVLGNICAETGVTALSVTAIISVVPDSMSFQYGTSYIRTILSVLPIGSMVGDFFNLASSTFVINKHIGVPVGSSFIADLYWNWGYLGGMLGSYFFGIIFYKVLRPKFTNSPRLALVLYFSLFSQMIILVRCELIDIFRSMFLFVIVVLIYKYFYMKGNKNEG